MLDECRANVSNACLATVLQQISSAGDLVVQKEADSCIMTLSGNGICGSQLPV